MNTFSIQPALSHRSLFLSGVKSFTHISDGPMTVEEKKEQKTAAGNLGGEMKPIILNHWYFIASGLRSEYETALFDVADAMAAASKFLEQSIQNHGKPVANDNMDKAIEQITAANKNLSTAKHWLECFTYGCQIPNGPKMGPGRLSEDDKKVCEEELKNLDSYLTRLDAIRAKLRY